MGATKRHLFNSRINSYSKLYKALGHPARLQIIELLLEGRQLNGQELHHEIGLSTATISRHLAILYEVGIVGYEVISSNCIYYASPQILEKLSECTIDLGNKSSSYPPQTYFNEPYQESV